MCLATIGIAATIGSQVLGGIAQAQSASYQAQVARNNAQIERQNAAYAASAGAAQAEKEGLAQREHQANMRAAIAANGVDVNSGSAAAVQESARQTGALDQATVSNNAALKTYGYESQATSEEAKANLDQSQVGYDIAGGILKGIGTVGGNAGQLGLGGSSSGSGGGSDVAPVIDSPNYDLPPAYLHMGGDNGGGSLDA